MQEAPSTWAPAYQQIYMMGNSQPTCVLCIDPHIIHYWWNGDNGGLKMGNRTLPSYKLFKVEKFGGFYGSIGNHKWNSDNAPVQ